MIYSHFQFICANTDEAAATNLFNCKSDKKNKHRPNGLIYHNNGLKLAK